MVYLLGCDAVVSRQGAVDELRQLKEEKKRKNFDHKSFKNEKPGPSSPTCGAPESYLWIPLFNQRGSETLGKGGTAECVRSGSRGARLWLTERPNVFTFVRA